MRDRHRGRMLLAALIGGWLAVWLAPNATAADEPSYDLDSLVYRSADIVRGKVTRSYQIGWSTLADVKLATAYAGDFRVDRTITIDLSGYEKKPPSNEKLPFAKGDELLLFLTGEILHDRTGNDPLPKTAQIYLPVESGVKFISGNAVYGFYQYGNPGPYVAVAEKSPSDAPEPLTELLEETMSGLPEARESPAQLAASLNRSMANVARWREKFKVAPRKEDILWLVSFLKDRSAGNLARQQRFPDDLLAEAAELRLAQLQDPTSLYRVLGLYLPRKEIIQYGLATPEGRDFLLDKIKSATEPQSAKLDAADALGEISCVYRSRTKVALEDGTLVIDDVGDADAKNSSYLTRIAELVSASGINGELAERLLQALQTHAEANLHGEAEGWDDPQVQSDCDAAAAALRKAYVPGASPRACFMIESICAEIGWSAFQNLHSTHGPIISILTARDPKHWMAPPAPSIAFGYEMVNLPWVPDAKNGLPNRVQLVLKPVSGGDSIVLPMKYPIPSGPSMNITQGGDAVALPKRMRTGRYRVFLRFLTNDKPVGESYGFEQSF